MPYGFKGVVLNLIGFHNFLTHDYQKIMALSFILKSSKPHQIYSSQKGDFLLSIINVVFFARKEE
tara:strand:+ start:336 stop:530 length:195 start_codon:yes stop_codon:yes gene_type:complete